MPLFANKSQVALKIEAVPGTLETLVAADVLLTTDLPSYTAGPEVIPRNALSASHDSRGHVIGKRSATISFKIYLRGTATAPLIGNPPDFNSAMRCCSTTVAFTGTTPNEISTYTPNSTALDYCSVAIYRDGKRYAIHGAQGNCVLTFKVGSPVMAEFTFTGVYNTPTNAALLAPTYSAIIEPPFLGAALSLLGYTTAKIDSLTLDLGNEVVIRPYSNTTTGLFVAQIVKRAPKGSFDAEEELTGTKDFWNEFIAGTTGAIQTGTFPSNGSNYNQFSLAMPKCQYSGAKLDTRDGIAVVGVEYTPLANASAGEDSWSLVQT